MRLRTNMLAAASVQVTERIKRGSSRFRPIYFDNQVDRAAALARSSPLPPGTNAARLIQGNVSPRDTARGTALTSFIILQVVIETDGGPDAARARVIRSNADSSTILRVRAFLPRMQFEPARIGATPVHQLAYLLLQMRETAGVPSQAVRPPL